MKKKVYEKPLAEIVVFQGNDRIIPGDPDGGIGAKPSTPWGIVNHSIWED